MGLKISQLPDKAAEDGMMIPASVGGMTYRLLVGIAGGLAKFLHKHEITDVTGLITQLAEKAPAGYGYGDIPIAIIASSDNESYEAYCAKVDAVLSTMGGGGVKQVFAYPPQVYGSGSYIATLFKSDINGLYASLTTTTTYSNADNTRGFTMRKFNGVWKPLEWINPPMAIGVEYRTTERYMGKPVYIKLISCGALPVANTLKTVAIGIANIQLIVRCEGRFGIFSTPFADDERTVIISATQSNINMMVQGTDAYVGYTANASIYYIKTTD